MSVEANYRLLIVPCFFMSVIIVATTVVNLNFVWADSGWSVIFSSDFEENDLTPSNGQLWSTLREQAPCNSGGSCLPGKQPSRVLQVTEKAHSGTKSLRCFSDGGDAIYVGKADIYKTNLNLRLGETYRVSAWYWLPVHNYFKTITLMDIECTAGSRTNDCDVPATAGPRLWVRQRRDPGPPRLQFGRQKLGRSNVEGSRPLPLGQWFKLTVEMTLGSSGSGHTRVWINDNLDIEFTGSNIQPSGMPGLNHYNSLQVGQTANATGTPPGQYSAVTIYVDDVLIEQKNEEQPLDSHPQSPQNVRLLP